jgi:predicted glycosyltransferase
MEYYRQAIELFPNERFLVFSDDLNKAKEMFGDRVTYSVSTNYLTDFALMKKCKSFITANSSYSLMAAILGEHPEKKIVCPKKWFGDCAGITFDGMYPENAIII